MFDISQTTTSYGQGFVLILWTSKIPHSGLPLLISEVIYRHWSMHCTVGESIHWSRTLKKRISSPLNSPGANCLSITGKPTLYLGASTVSNSRALSTTLYSLVIPTAFEGLVDSGFSDCFLNSSFVIKNQLPFWEITPLFVALIDGTVNVFVTHVVLLPINFSCSYSCTLEFYITKLKSTYLAVLRFSWLIHYNIAIDWVKKTILFQIPDPSQTDQMAIDHGISNTAPQKTQLVYTENQTLLIPITPPLSLTPKPTNL